MYGLLTVSANRTRFAAMDGVERPGAFDAPVVANVLLGWRPNAKWELSGRVRTATGLPTTPFVSAGVREGTLDFSRYNAGGRLPQFFTLDARIDRRWQIGKSQLITYLDVQNATARQNVSAVAWTPRRSARRPSASCRASGSIGRSRFGDLFSGVCRTLYPYIVVTFGLAPAFFTYLSSHATQRAH